VDIEHEKVLMNNDAEKYPAYRWVVLGSAWLVLACLVWAWFLIPSLAHYLLLDLNLNQTQFTLLLTAPFLMGIFTPIIGGALGDRFGIRVVIALCALGAGITGIARISATSFTLMFTLMSLYGVCYGVMMPNLPKLVGIWYPSHQAGIANGIILSGLNIGAALGLFTGPLFPGWKTAFVAVSALMLVMATLWVILGRNAPKGITILMPSIITGIKRGIVSKNVWLIACGQCLFMGAFVGLSGNFLIALEKIHRVNPQTAGAIASLLTWGVTLGNFLVPMVSDKVGLRKIFVSSGALVSATCFILAWYLAPGTATGVFIFAGGLFFGGIQPVLFAILVELPEIGPECLGGTSGVVSTLLNAGGFLIPLLVISPLLAPETAGAYTTGFFITSLIIAIIALLTAFLIETGARGKHRFR